MPYSKNQDNRFVVLPDGRLVFAGLADDYSQVVVAIENTEGGDWDVYTLSSSTDDYYSVDIEMTPGGDLFMLVGQTDSMADGAPTAQRDIYLYERPLSASAWSQVALDFSASNKLNEGCTTISESSVDIRYSANMAVDNAGNPAILYLECNTYYQAKYIYKTASGWNREDFRFFSRHRASIYRAEYPIRFKQQFFYHDYSVIGGGFVRLDKNMNNPSTALSETEMDEKLRCV